MSRYNLLRLYSGLFNITSNSTYFHLFIFFLSILILNLTSFYPRKFIIEKDESNKNIEDEVSSERNNKENSGRIILNQKTQNQKILNKYGEQFKIIEYSLIILFVIIGSILNSELATSGGLTYFLLGSLSSCFILLGISLLYANSGITNLDGLYIVTSISEIVNNTPDVYDAIPTIVTTYVAIIAKISIFIFFLELTNYTSTIVGLTQTRIKRLYAYSTISHLGFILLSLSIYSYSLYHYVNTNKKYESLLDKNNSPIQLINQIKGYFYINPIMALSIPPLIGFFAKQMVLSAAINNGYIFMSLVAIITSVISAVYYLAIIKQMFFDTTEYEISSDIKNITLSSSLTIIISIITYIILLFILLPNE
ncbi:hypothetical protein EV356DRAFT_522101 [Viridothelium virens]|uniref:NADH-ubiquinone oxidoreductase chain 2 n=1 Tax=Viridothelium virens TaxID=1048519 RepID=A0A6A6GSM6_VIRVR|nr:hypothetical protein EV356DRAFT_522101 [Viridothelium virens]